MKLAHIQEDHIFSGFVVPGKQLGRTIGFPTANMDVFEDMIYENGVYGVFVYFRGRRYQGVMNVGARPTFNDGCHRTYEVHILDFSEDLYDQELTVEIMFYIRPEQKFDNLQSLIQQLHSDVFYTRKQLH